MHSSGSGLGLVPHGGPAGSFAGGGGASDCSIPIAQRRAVTGFFAGSEWGALLLTTNAAANIQLYQIDPQSFTLIKIAECYLGANIQGLERLRIGTNPKDYILAALEGGAILILEYNPQNVTFELVDQERYQSTFHTWLIWGRNMVSDWKSRCVLIGNVEDCKIVYILVDPAETKLSVALPTVDAIPGSVLYSVVSVESSWRNPIFACLEAYHRPSSTSSSSPGSSAAAAAAAAASQLNALNSEKHREETILLGEKMLVYYELDLEQNQVFRRWDTRVESSSNLVIPVPGDTSGTGTSGGGSGSSGPGGVLVCRRNIVQWLHERRSPQSVPIPRHPSLSLDVELYLVTYTSVSGLPNSPTPMVLAQSIFGDIYLIEFKDDVLSIKFFDSIPQSEQLFLLSNRFLLSCAQTHYPRVYYLLSIGDDDDPDQPVYTSLEHTEPEEAFFRPRNLRHLTSTMFMAAQQQQQQQQKAVARPPPLQQGSPQMRPPPQPSQGPMPPRPGSPMSAMSAAQQFQQQQQQHQRRPSVRPAIAPPHPGQPQMQQQQYMGPPRPGSPQHYASPPPGTAFARPPPGVTMHYAPRPPPNALPGQQPYYQPPPGGAQGLNRQTSMMVAAGQQPPYMRPPPQQQHMGYRPPGPASGAGPYMQQPPPPGMHYLPPPGQQPHPQTSPYRQAYQPQPPPAQFHPQHPPHLLPPGVQLAPPPGAPGGPPLAIHPGDPNTIASRASSLAHRQQVLVGGRTASLRRPKSQQTIMHLPATPQQQLQHRMVQPGMLNKRYSSLRRPATAPVQQAPPLGGSGLGAVSEEGAQMGEGGQQGQSKPPKQASRTHSMDSGYTPSVSAGGAAAAGGVDVQQMQHPVHDSMMDSTSTIAGNEDVGDASRMSIDTSNSTLIGGDSQAVVAPTQQVQSPMGPAATNVPAPVPMPETPEKRRKQLELRSYVANEVHETELSYRESLTILLTQFKAPLEEQKLVPSVFVRLVFTGVQALLDFSASFAAELQVVMDNWDDESSQLAPLFLAHRDDFGVFLKFVDNYSNALNMVRRAEESNDQFKQFNERCKHSRDTNRQQLQDFLILPIQRATRYPLLLKDVRKHTPPDHPDAANLTSALMMMNDIAAQVNHVKQQEEEMTRMFTMFKQVEGCPPIVIKYSRRLILEVDVTEVTGVGASSAAAMVGLSALVSAAGGKQHALKLYLMSDLLLMAKVHKKKVKFIRLIDLADLAVKERGSSMIVLDIEQGSVSTASNTLNAKHPGGGGGFGGAFGGVGGGGGRLLASLASANGQQQDASLPSSYVLNMADEKARQSFMLALMDKIRVTRDQRVQEGGVFSLPRTAGAVPITSLSPQALPPITIPVSSGAVGVSTPTSVSSPVAATSGQDALGITTPVSRGSPMGGSSAANSMPSSPLSTGPVMLPPGSGAFDHGSLTTSAANKRTSTTLKVSSRPTSMSTPSLAGSGGSHGNGMDFASQVGASLASLSLLDAGGYGNGIGEDTTVLGGTGDDADDTADDAGNDTSRYSTFAVLDGEDGDAPSPQLMPGSPDMTVVADSTMVATDASDPGLEGMSLVGLPSAISTPHAARLGGHLSNMYSHSESSLDTFRVLVGTSIEEEPAGTAGPASAGGSNVSLSGRRPGGASSSNGGADGEGLVRMSSAISLPNPDLDHGAADDCETGSLDGLDSGTSARRKMSWTISFGGGGSSSGKKK